MTQEIVTENATPETPASSVAAGQRLRAAREAQGLSRDEVARELRLNEKLIGALEEGDRDQLPPATFISGYLRAYARLLGLPADQLVGDYLDQQVVPSLYRTSDRSGMQMPSSRDPKFRLTTYTVVAVLLVLFSAWWVNQRFDFVSLEPARDDVATELEVEADLPAPSPLLDYAPVDEAPSSTVDVEGAEQPAAVSDAQANMAAPPLPATAPASTSAPATPVPVTPTESAKPQPPQPLVVTEPLSATTPQSLLVLEYQAASWTQVEDANGRVLVYEVVRPGRKLELRGVAPFKVFLGYAPGVLVYYNGSLFSHAPYQRGELARFRVGASADNRPLDR